MASGIPAAYGACLVIVPVGAALPCLSRADPAAEFSLYECAVLLKVMLLKRFVAEHASPLQNPHHPPNWPFWYLKLPWAGFGQILRQSRLRQTSVQSSLPNVKDIPASTK
jgi:hypothetical protein